MSASETNEGFTCQYCQKSYVNGKSHTRHEEKCPSREVVEYNQRIAELEEELGKLQYEMEEERIGWAREKHKIMTDGKKMAECVVQAKDVIEDQSVVIRRLKEEQPVIFKSKLALVDFINDLISDQRKSVKEEEIEEEDED